MIVRSALILLLLFFALSASAEENRVALVIGNSDYKHAPTLKNPRNDAQAVAKELAELGFIVLEGYDLDFSGTKSKLREFSNQVQGSDVALLYYAGHALQVNGQNYLLPVDADPKVARDLRYDAFSMPFVMAELTAASRLRLAILDACRDNPFNQRMTGWGGSRSVVSRGLARIDTSAKDTLIAYATRADAVAEDGNAKHSPYTKALLEHIGSPDVDVRVMFGRVRDSVVADTKGRQEPYTYGSLGGDRWYFNPAPLPARAEDSSQDSGAAGYTPQDPKLDDTALALTYWNQIKQERNAEFLQAFLEQVDNPVLKPLIAARLRELESGDGNSVERKAIEPSETPSGESSTGAASPKSTESSAPTEDEEKRKALARATEIQPQMVQLSLKELGYYKGAIDGILGGGSKRSIASFQQASGFVPTGILTNAQKVNLIRTAAEAGHASSQNTLGMMAAEGVGIPKDTESAFRWFQAAAAQGDPHASYNLGVLYREGRGVEKSETDARIYFQLAHRGGHPKALQALKALGK